MGTFMCMLGVGIDALEVDVQNQLLVGVHLHITQQNLGFGAPASSMSRTDAWKASFLMACHSALWSSSTNKGSPTFHRKRCQVCDPNCGDGGSHPCPAWRAQKRQIS
jgi:hypothetical protein